MVIMFLINPKSKQIKYLKSISNMGIEVTDDISEAKRFRSASNTKTDKAIESIKYYGYIYGFAEATTTKLRSTLSKYTRQVAIIRDIANNYRIKILPLIVEYDTSGKNELALILIDTYRKRLTEIVVQDTYVVSFRGTRCELYDKYGDIAYTSITRWMESLPDDNWGMQEETML